MAAQRYEFYFRVVKTIFYKRAQVQISRQFKSTIHDDFAFVRGRGGFKALYEALWDHQRFTYH